MRVVVAPATVTPPRQAACEKAWEEKENEGDPLFVGWERPSLSRLIVKVIRR